MKIADKQNYSRLLPKVQELREFKNMILEYPQNTTCYTFYLRVYRVQWHWFRADPTNRSKDT